MFYSTSWPLMVQNPHLQAIIGLTVRVSSNSLTTMAPKTIQTSRSTTATRILTKASVTSVSVSTISRLRASVLKMQDTNSRRSRITILSGMNETVADKLQVDRRSHEVDSFRTRS